MSSSVMIEIFRVSDGFFFCNLPAASGLFLFFSHVSMGGLIWFDGGWEDGRMRKWRSVDACDSSLGRFGMR
jgi:hypothetical protein